MTLEYVLLFGRFLLGGYFIFAGVNHLTNTRALTEAARERGVLQPALLVLATGLILALGGLGIFFWILPGTAALSLAGFLILSAAIMHPFWLLRNAAPELRTIEMRYFWGNIALAGALMIVATRVVPAL